MWRRACPCRPHRATHFEGDCPAGPNNAAQLWERDNEAVTLTALQLELQPVLEIKASARDEAQAEGKKTPAELEIQG